MDLRGEGPGPRCWPCGEDPLEVRRVGEDLPLPLPLRLWGSSITNPYLSRRRSGWGGCCSCCSGILGSFREPVEGNDEEDCCC